ncbi:MAG: type II toxin-antitoxin system HicA family toxin [Chitinispirillia bacterium]|nr:type II toxin-antitoxin system HicA family toxin [Chitinispirillia bacterium]
MGKKDKLITRLKSVPKDFTFDELKTLLGLLGYVMSNVGKTSGSRVCFMRENIPLRIHKPHPENELKPYQIKDVINILTQENLI